MSGPPLWLVSAGQAQVFLFGQGPWGVREDDPWLEGAVLEAFEQSVEFWHEVPDDPRLVDGELIAQYGLDPRGLGSRVDSRVQSEVDGAAAAVGLDPRTLDGCRPWLAAQLLDGALKAAAGGQLVDVEGALSVLARAAGKRVGVEFADAEALLSTFAGLDVAEVEYLSWTADRVSSGVEEMRRQADAWLRGDVRVFEEDLARIRHRWPRFHSDLFRARNQAWVPRIEQMVAEAGVVFVVMGMGHLVNEDGVVALAEGRGLSADRVQ